jgi:hypothetical protein
VSLDRRTLLCGLAGLGTAALAPAPSFAAYARPYGPNAAWNISVAGLPLHPESARFAKKIWNSRPDQPGNINCNFDEYTYPIYDVAQKTGNYPVIVRFSEWGSNLIGKKIPFASNWLPGSGSDRQVIIIDPVTGCEWNLWRAKFSSGKIYIDNGNLVPGSYWTRETGFRPSRGCGIPYLAMLVRPHEVAAGIIHHALSMPLKGIHKSVFVAPATKTDGPIAPYALTDGVPEGMRFALNVSDAEIESWVASLPLSSTGKQSARVIGRALRDYGWFITDNAGAATLQFEDRKATGAMWSNLGLSKVSANGKEYPRDLLDGLMREERIYAVVPSDQY